MWLLDFGISTWSLRVYWGNEHIGYLVTSTLMIWLLLFCLRTSKYLSLGVFDISIFIGVFWSFYMPILLEPRVILLIIPLICLNVSNVQIKWLKVKSRRKCYVQSNFNAKEAQKPNTRLSHLGNDMDTLKMQDDDMAICWLGPLGWHGMTLYKAQSDVEECNLNVTLVTAH